MDRTGSGSCPVAGFGISVAGFSSYSTSVSKTDLKEMGCENLRWMNWFRIVPSGELCY